MTEATETLASKVIDLILKPQEGEESVTFDVDHTVDELMGVIAYVVAFVPDLDTPQKVRRYSEWAAKRLRHLIPSAQEAQAGLRGAITTERATLQ